MVIRGGHFVVKCLDYSLNCVDTGCVRYDALCHLSPKLRGITSQKTVVFTRLLIININVYHYYSLSKVYCIKQHVCVILGIHCGVNGIFALLGC